MLHPQPISPVPVETVRVAHAAFPKGNALMLMRDELGAIYEDEAFAHLFPRRGQPAEAPWRLALVTIFQFAESLSDRRAADAVRSRIDWKYALSLELDDPGFDASVLCEFRARLLEGGGQLLLDTLLARFREMGLLKVGRQRTDSTHVLAAVRALDRVELVGETMRHALDVLATVDPDWLREHAEPEWAKRYARRAEDDRLPSKKEQRRAQVETIGGDGYSLLDAVYASDAPGWLREVPAIRTLRRIWVQQYVRIEQGYRFRTDEDGLPPAVRFIASPHEPDAHYARKYSTSWIGYKVHLTETCEDEAPNLITNVETTSGPVADGDATPIVHEDLKRKGLLPEVHLVDTGYLDAELLVATKREYGVDLLGPTRRDYRWQARAGVGFAAENFAIDWEHNRATCPEGHNSVQWTPAIDKRRNHVVKIRFSTRDCRACPSLSLCVRSKRKYPRRLLTVRPKEQYEALRERREFEETREYAKESARRQGIEGTISRGVRRCGMRRSRYVGLPKTHLGHVLTAASLNFIRVAEWLAGSPRAKTRRSPFATLMSQPVG